MSLTDILKAENLPDRVLLFNELGAQGKTRVQGRMYEDYDYRLKGRQALRVFEEMENDATVASFLYAVRKSLLQVEWHTEPATDQRADIAAAEFLEEQRLNMSHTWTDFLEGALGLIVYGWAFHEVVYKPLGSGRVGWGKMPAQPHSAFVQWETDDAGDIIGLTETTGMGQRVTIPIEKAILIQANHRRKSMLRPAYNAWYMKKHLMEQEAIGFERNLSGLPVMRVPAQVLLGGGAEFNVWKDVVTRTKRDEQMGVLIPSDRDEAGNPLYEFELMSASGTVDPGPAIRRYSVEILQTVLADWLALGTDAVGSRALADPKIVMFQTALEATLDMIGAAFHRQATTRLFALNTIPTPGGLPRLVPGDIQKADLEGIANLILRTSQAGAEWFGEEDGQRTEAWLREKAGLPVEGA